MEASSKGHEFYQEGAKKGSLAEIPEEWYEPDNLGDISFQPKFITGEFSPQQWVTYFKKYTAKSWIQSAGRAKATRMHHGLRVVIALQTIECCNEGYYCLPSEGATQRRTIYFNKEYLREQIKKTEAYSDTPQLPPVSERFQTETAVYQGDCLDAAHWLLQQGCNPCVLNMANQSQPGGGFHTGSGAQEENLHRRSNYFQSLEDPQRINPKGGKKNYPIAEEGAIYSPNICVFRSNEARGYAFLEKPYLMSFIACAALRHPPLLYSKERGFYLNEEAKEATLVKIRTILAVAALHGHDAVVLSAFGCGAFSNPPKDVALLFKEVIESDAFAGRFKRIVFAIFDDHNASKQHNPEGNVKPFVDVFKNTLDLSSFSAL